MAFGQKCVWQRGKLCGKLGRSFPVGLGTSSRILRGSPAVFLLSRNFAVTYAFGQGGTKVSVEKGTKNLG